MDTETFRIRVVPLYRRLYATAVAITHDSDDAADIVQDAMVKLWNARDKLDNIKSIEAYSLIMVKNASFDSISAGRRNTVDINSISSDETPTVERHDGTEILQNIIESLPGNQRQVICMNAFDGLSNEQIASATGFTLDNVRQLLSRGRRRIKELYNKYQSI